MSLFCSKTLSVSSCIPILALVIRCSSTGTFSLTTPFASLSPSAIEPDLSSTTSTSVGLLIGLYSARTVTFHLLTSPFTGSAVLIICASPSFKTFSVGLTGAAFAVNGIEKTILLNTSAKFKTNAKIFFTLFNSLLLSESLEIYTVDFNIFKI